MVHRPPALKVDQPAGVHLGRVMALIAIGTLQFAWLGWFLLERLPNAGNVGGDGLNRLQILIRALPQVVPGVKFSESYLGLALAELGHVENLPQRVPIVLAAAFIAASAIAFGNLAVRALGLWSHLDRWERPALGFGLGTTGLGLVTLILGRLGLIHPWEIRVGLVVPIAAELALAIRRRPSVDLDSQSNPIRVSPWPIVGFAMIVGPFLLIMALGAMLPTVDFDAIEYHVQGPKEYYQAGRIAFLPHNVYTSMPFSIEMLHLLGMEVVGDWWLGALVGQLLVASFTPATAAMIALTARRIGSPRAAWVSAVVYLTTPWIYRLAVLPYVEGPLCFYHAALLWAISFAASPRAISIGKPDRMGLLVGLLAGGAMAIKYPALISAVVPFSGWAVWESWRSRDWKIAAGYALGVALVMAPWLVKNVIDTNNPVYPLGYQVFGAKFWDEGRDMKWSAAHGPKPIEGRAFVQSIVDVAGRSDWQSPLYTALVPLAFLCRGGRRQAFWIASFAAYLFMTWWLLTHRLDRFWLPILPPLAILAGLGADWVRSKLWTGLLVTVMSLSIITNASYSSTALAGLNEWTGDLTKLRTGIPAMLNPPLARLDAELPRNAKPLLVGQAAVFHLDRPIVYNTVFNEETIETIAKGRSARQVGEELRERGVTHIYVDWFEIDRYRSPGNYGFTPFVTPEVFARLVEAGVLGPPVRLGLRQDLYEVRAR